MHQELVDELLRFAVDHKLLLICDFDEKRKVHRFGFQDREQTWLYTREFAQEQLDLCNVPTVYFAQELIETLKRKVPHLL